MSRYSMLLGLALVCTWPAPAGSQPAGGGANPISDAIRAQWEGAKRNVRQSAALMPEGDFHYKPTPEVRSFGEILAHIAGANYVICSAARGEPSPHEEAAFEKTARSKAAIVKVLDESIAYCDAAFAALTDAKAAEIVDQPFGQGRAARAAALMGNTTHLNEHYGNLVTYFRMKGLVPPSSRPSP